MDAPGPAVPQQWRNQLLDAATYEIDYHNPIPPICFYSFQPSGRLEKVWDSSDREQELKVGFERCEGGSSRPRNFGHARHVESRDGECRNRLFSL